VGPRDLLRGVSPRLCATSLPSRLQSVGIGCLVRTRTRHDLSSEGACCEASLRVQSRRPGPCVIRQSVGRKVSQRRTVHSFAFSGAPNVTTSELTLLRAESCEISSSSQGFGSGSIVPSVAPRLAAIKRGSFRWWRLGLPRRAGYAAKPRSRSGRTPTCGRPGGRIRARR
jgi:hypothetical protein